MGYFLIFVTDTVVLFAYMYGCVYAFLYLIFLHYLLIINVFFNRQVL